MEIARLFFPLALFIFATSLLFESLAQATRKVTVLPALNNVFERLLSAPIAWSFRVISNSDEKPRSVHIPVLALGRESKGHIPLLYNR